MKKARPSLKTRVERNTSYEKDMAAAFNDIFQNIVRIEKGKHSRLPELQGHPGGSKNLKEHMERRMISHCTERKEWTLPNNRPKTTESF